VSNVEEGAILRDRGITARILVMADFLAAERAGLLEYNLTPVLHSLPDVAEWDRLVAASGSGPREYHLKIDTGMGRLGTRASAAEILEAIGAAGHARLEGLMTHFASSANYASTQTDEQLHAFESICSELARAGVHAPILHSSSSTPVAYGRRGAWHRMVRPGHAVYGYVSQTAGTAPPRLLDVRPALSWKAAVLAVKDLPAGALVGYGGMHRTAHPARIAVLAAGYADGIPHRLSNKGRVIANGHWAPIIGAVSMDLTTIDVTHCPPLGPGDAVTFIGSEGDLSIDAQQMARVAGTISYSVLCGIHARVKRIYVDGES
jgi:alanine racemase